MRLWPRDVGRDLRFALRALVKRPGFTAAATLTLAVGVGANTAIFTFADGMLFRPLPYPDPGRLVAIVASGARGGWVPEIDFVEARRRHTGFEGVADFSGPGLGTVVDAGGASLVMIYALSEGYLRTLGVRPLIGRDFLPDDHVAGRAPVALVQHHFWRNQLGGDPSVIGRRLRFDELFLPHGREPETQPVEVIGVLPPSFVLPDNVNPRTELFVPRVETTDDDLDPRALRAPVARLRRGVTVAQAEAEMQVLVGGLIEAHPEISPDRRARLVPLQEHLFRSVQPLLLILLGCAALVLLIACANLASLLLARGVARQRELAVRAALGASRWRLARQLLMESLTLALPGGVVGLIGGYWLFAFMSAQIPAGTGGGNVFRLIPAGLDARVVGFAFGAAAVSALVFGLLPATRFSGKGHGTLRGDGIRGPFSRGRTFLRINPIVVAEVALALVLLTSAGLLATSFFKMLAVDLGYRSDGVATLGVNLPSSRYPTDSSRLSSYRDLYTRLRDVRGATAVGGIDGLPMFTTGGRLYADGEPVGAGVFNVIPGYFRALGIPLLKGRDFTETEAFEEGDVSIVDERAAALLWPDQEPIGQRYIDGDDRSFVVVGVVANTRPSFTRDEVPMVFLPLSASRRVRALSFVAHSEVGLDRFRPALEAAVRRFDPSLVAAVGSLTEAYEFELGSPRFRTMFLGVFAVLAFLLATGGIYGVVNCAIAPRVKEIGLRMALGAPRWHVCRMIVGESFVSVGVGIILGGAGAFWGDTADREHAERDQPP